MKYFFLLLAVLFFVSPSFATINLDGQSSIEFFASNNTDEITLQSAFIRLCGGAQTSLQNDIIELMQKEHIEQGKFENLLGTYRMSIDQHSTADNSEVFVTSSHQKLSSKTIFKIARELATTLKQESVVVFIPSHASTIGVTILKLRSHSYTIKEAMEIIYAKLPLQYSQAYSLQLNNLCTSFDGAIVKEIQWLGSKARPDEIQKAFPREEIYYHYGKAYLIFDDGHKEQF